MSKQTGVLLELLTDPARSGTAKSAHLLGQVAAEVIAGGPDQSELKELAATALFQRQECTENPAEGGSVDRGLMYSVLAGLFQTLLVFDTSKVDAAKGQGTVKERILYVLAEAEESPTVIAQKAECAPEVASRALRSLRGDGLVERVTPSPGDDRRYHLYRLTAAGEQFIAGRFLGDDTPLPDQLEPPPAYDAAEQLVSMTRTVRHIGKHDPSIAATIAPTLEHLADSAADPQARADALGELCVLGRGATDMFSPEDKRRWYEGLLDLGHHSPSITARACYERGRWRQLYGAGEDNTAKALRDFTRARGAAESIVGDEKPYRLAWCFYQEATIAVHERRGEDGAALATQAREHFESITDEQFKSGQGVLACDILAARASWLGGNPRAARNKLQSVLTAARDHNYKRQIADARRWLGIIGADDGERDAGVYLGAAEVDYAELANSRLAAVTRAQKSSSDYLNSDKSHAQGEVLKSELRKVLEELSAAGGPDMSPLLYWQQAQLGRVIASITAWLDTDGHEANDAYREALELTAKFPDRGMQAEVLAEWWCSQWPDQPATVFGLRGLVGEADQSLVSDEVVNGAILLQDNNCQPCSAESEEANRDAVRRVLLTC